MRIGIGALGLSPEDFWKLTPYELSIKIESKTAESQEKIKLALFTAWHSAAFAREKRLSKLDRLIQNLDKRANPRGATPEQKPESLEELARKKGLDWR